MITISTPCNEDWAAMTPGAEGRYCAKCQLSVIDFSQMDEGQILDTLRQATGRVCGRVPLSRMAAKFRTSAAVFAAAFLLAYGVPQAASAQADTTAVSTKIDGKKGVSGRLLYAYDKNAPIANLRVELWQDGKQVYSTQTDDKGNWYIAAEPGTYQLELGNHMEWQADTYEVVVPDKRMLKLGNMQAEVMMMGDVAAPEGDD